MFRSINPNIKIVCNLFYFLLLVDTINGLFLSLGISIPISVCYKLIIIAITLKLYISSSHNVIKAYLVLLYFVILILYFAIYVEVDSVFDSLSLYIRFIIAPLGLWVFSRLSLSAPQQALEYSRRIIIYNVIIICVNIVLSLVGIGYTSYGEGLGNKGFFYAANEVSGLIILLFGMQIFFLRLVSNTKRFLFASLFFLILSISLGTKTAMGGYFLVFIYISYTSTISKRSRKGIMFLGLALLIPAIIYSGYYYVERIGLLERWRFFYERSDDIISFMLSGRDLFWAEEKGDFLSSGTIGYILGLGNNRTVEMDPFDVFLNYGGIGIAFVYTFWFFMIRQAYCYSKYNIIAKIVLFIDIELLLFSSLTGHIIFSGMLNPFIALINSLIYIPDRYILLRKNV